MENMNKKILLTLAILIAALAIISVACASEPVAVNGNSIKVNGLEFNIPEGFAYDENDTQAMLRSYNNEFDPNTVVALTNSSHDNIYIFVLNNEENKSLSDFANNYTIEKTIAGKNGVMLDNNFGEIQFIYLDGNKIVLIDADNENLISSVIK